MIDDLVARLYRLPPPETDRSLPQECAAEIERLRAENDHMRRRAIEHIAEVSGWMQRMQHAEAEIERLQTELAKANRALDQADLESLTFQKRAERAEAERDALRKSLADGYRSGTCVTNEYFTVIHLNYEQPNQANLAFWTITDAITAARGKT